MTWAYQSKSSVGLPEVDFLFSDGLDFLFSDGTDYVFREGTPETVFSYPTKNTATYTSQTKNTASYAYATKN